VSDDPKQLRQWLTDSRQQQVELMQRILELEEERNQLREELAAFQWEAETLAESLIEEADWAAWEHDCPLTIARLREKPS
jgi:uncharacterized protein YhaN